MSDMTARDDDLVVVAVSDTQGVGAGRGRRRYTRPGQATYTAVHVQLGAARGAAADHSCTDCPQPATDWSYDNADPRELTDRSTGCAYSLDLIHYLPRCRSCHRRADWARRREGRAPLDPATVLMHYRDGLGLRAIGGMFGYTARDVRELLVAEGEPIRATSRRFGYGGASC